MKKIGNRKRPFLGVCESVLTRVQFKPILASQENHFKGEYFFPAWKKVFFFASLFFIFCLSVKVRKQK